MSAVPLQADGGGVISRLLSNNGVPYAETLGAAIAFVIALLAVYVLGRAVVLPLADRLMDARGLEVHARRPLRKLLLVIVVFVGITVGFGFAGYGSFLQSLATVAAAATLAIGLAMQDVLANFVAGIFIFTDKPFRIGDWIEWDGNSG
ncbi:MAG: mechanosensitive ion channel domain-containing protein, partial [Haloplanus sp.]